MKKIIKKTIIMVLISMFVTLGIASYKEPIYMFSYYEPNTTHCVYLYTGPDWQNQRY